MELREYYDLWNRRKIVLLGFSLFVALSALAWSVWKQETYHASISLMVKRIPKQETPYYDDGYFGIQSADLFSQTVISWFLTPSVLIEIYERAGVDPEISSLSRFTSRFKTRKYSPQNIVVRFEERDEKTTKALAEAIREIVEEKAVTMNPSSDQKAIFEITAERPVIVREEQKTLLVTIVGFFVGLITALLFLYLHRYLTTPSSVS